MAWSRCARILLVALAHTDASKLAGDPSCPCLGNVLGAHSNGSCIEFTPPNLAGLSPESYCYPLGYGSDCRAWDSGLSPYCSSAGEPAFCSSAWCYVDLEKCRHSQMDVQVSSY